jgi:hypothetical protein
VVWFHNESTFYTNNWRVSCWVHKNKDLKPYAKGEGPLQMVADLVSADYGWLQSPDGAEEARVLFKAGKNCEGYFTSEDILKQAEKAINILKKITQTMIMFSFMIMQQHTLNEQMVPYQHVTCQNSHRNQSPIGWWRSMLLTQTESQFMHLMVNY